MQIRYKFMEMLDDLDIDYSETTLFDLKEIPSRYYIVFLSNALQLVPKLLAVFCNTS